MKKRLIYLYLILTILVLAVFSLIQLRYSNNMIRSEMSVRLLENTAFIEQMFPVESTLRKPGDLDEKARDYKGLMTQSEGTKQKTIQPRVTFIRKDGVVVGDSETDSVQMEVHSDRLEVIAALKTGTGSSERYSKTLQVSFLYFARYYPEKDLIIRIAMPLDAVKAVTQSNVKTAGMTIFFSLLLALFFASLLSGVVVSPIKTLSAEMATLPEGSYKKRIAMPNDSTLTPLAKKVNDMADHLEQSKDEMAEQATKMDSIIQNLQYGLIAVDTEMKLMLVNPVLFALFGLNEQVPVPGKPVVEVVRNNALLAMLEEVMQSNTVLKKEVLVFDGGKRILEIHAYPIPSQEKSIKNAGAIAHVLDITSMRRLEELRSEFVANVSHELKTPLTSIRGFVETLRSGTIEDAAVSAKFLDIIDIEAERLGVLINDILSLAEMERFRQEPEQANFLLAPVVSETLQLLDTAAEAKHIDFVVEVAPGLILQANQDRIKQLLLNLLDNAVKYNKEGGQVTVRAFQNKDKAVEIQISDTGIGIAEIHQDRIFERFYRVDKGRSREQGGTGLGLSIVKHIAKLVGGTISVISEPGKGSTFVVVLPSSEETKAM